MTDLHAEDIAVFKNGQRRLMRVTQPGTAPVITKTGTVEKPFAAGDFLLADETGHVIVMPLDMETAVAIATEIVEGNAYFLTSSHSLRALAVAVLAIHHTQQSPSPESAEAAMQAPATTGAPS
jgi:hypothetical protein